MSSLAAGGALGKHDLGNRRNLLVRNALRLNCGDFTALASDLLLWRGLMICITDTTELGRNVFRIDGQLNAEDVSVLDKKCSEAGRPHILDLSNLRSADTAGTEKLCELATSGVEIRGASPYLRLLLDDSG